MGNEMPYLSLYEIGYLNGYKQKETSNSSRNWHKRIARTNKGIRLPNHFKLRQSVAEAISNSCNFD